MDYDRGVWSNLLHILQDEVIISNFGGRLAQFFCASRSPYVFICLAAMLKRTALDASPKRDNYLILGIGTDVGKSFLVEKLCLNNPDVIAIKPVITGFHDDDLRARLKSFTPSRGYLAQSTSDKFFSDSCISEKKFFSQLGQDNSRAKAKDFRRALASDSARILTAMGLEISKKNLDAISPWRFRKAVSPHFAGNVDFAALKKFCKKRILEAKKDGKTLLIEAAGGVMTPINQQKTFLDLAVELKIPVLLVSTNYLGAISHTLTAVEVLRSRKIEIAAVVMNERGEGESIGGVIEKMSGVKISSLEDFCDNRK